MKRFLFTLTVLLSVAFTASAMSYTQARRHALFLADKMAYELNLTQDQYEAVYEINLDYLMKIDAYDDLYGIYWEQRNLDLRYILFDWQYRAFLNASYFYRPLYYERGYWRFALYGRYPRRDYYYFGEPHFYTIYRGSHSWYNNGNRSWYYGRSFGNGSSAGSYGMRDSFDRGDWDYRSRSTSPSRRNSDLYNDDRRYYGNRGYNHDYNRRYDSFGNRQSSTRVTVDRSYNNSSFGNDAYRESRSYDRSSSSSSSFGSVSPSRSGSSSSSSSFEGRSNSSSSSSFGGASPSRSSSFSAPSSSSGSNFSGSSRSSSSFESRSSSAPSSSFGGASPSRSSSFGAPSSSTGSNFSGSTRSSSSFESRSSGAPSSSFGGASPSRSGATSSPGGFSDAGVGGRR